MKNANNPKFNEHKGRVAELATPESRAKGTMASHAAAKRNTAMRKALHRVMSVKAGGLSTMNLEFDFPELRDTDIDGYTEIALLLRTHARKNPHIAMKLAEMLGAADGRDESEP